MRTLHKSQKTEYREEGGYRFRINWYYDEDGDYSWLGDYQRNDNGEEWLVDRKLDILYGEYQYGICIHCGRDDCQTQVRGTWVCDDCHWTLDEYTSDDELEEVGRKEYETIAHCWYDSNSYRYWKPSENHCPPEHDDVRPYEKWRQDWLDKHGWGSVTEANIHAMLEDHETVEDLSKGHIWFEGYVVTMYKDGIELEEDSCWGFLDVDDKYREETIQDAISELLARAKGAIQREIERRELQIKVLRDEA